MTTIKEQMGKITDEVQHLINKSTDDIKTSTKAVSVGIEKITGLREIQA
jgi:hypothetical protein